jgi:hypothetical protein
MSKHISRDKQPFSGRHISGGIVVSPEKQQDCEYQLLSRNRNLPHWLQYGRSIHEDPTRGRAPRYSIGGDKKARKKN